MTIDGARRLRRDGRRPRPARHRHASASASASPTRSASWPASNGRTGAASRRSRCRRDGAAIAACRSTTTTAGSSRVGGEYDVTQKIAVRAGVGYELSPIDDENRIVPAAGQRSPLALGGRQLQGERPRVGRSRLQLHHGQGHRPACLGRFRRRRPGRRNGPFFGEADSDVHIIAAAVKIKLGAMPAAAAADHEVTARRSHMETRRAGEAPALFSWRSAPARNKLAPPFQMLIISRHETETRIML